MSGKRTVDNLPPNGSSVKQTNKVQVQYFAVLREQAGMRSEAISTSAATLADLYEELKGRHGFSLPASLVKVSVELKFVPLATPLQEGMEIVFIPPVAGG